MTTDPRQVEPQRLAPETDGPEGAPACGEHRYWCWKRITAITALGLLLAGAATAIVRRVAR